MTTQSSAQVITLNDALFAEHQQKTKKEVRAFLEADIHTLDTKLDCIYRRHVHSEHNTIEEEFRLEQLIKKELFCESQDRIDNSGFVMDGARRECLALCIMSGCKFSSDFTSTFGVILGEVGVSQVEYTQWAHVANTYLLLAMLIKTRTPILDTRKYSYYIQQAVRAHGLSPTYYSRPDLRPIYTQIHITTDILASVLSRL